MSTLVIHLFGGVRATLDEQPLGAFPTRWASGLFAYLALHRGHLVHRDILTTLFWPEESDGRARKFLRNALWRVRSLVEQADDGHEFLVTDGHAVGLRGGEGVWVDVAEFDTLVDEARFGRGDAAPQGRLEAAVRLYQGDLMDGHDHPWCVYERQRLRLTLLEALERLMEIHMIRGEWRLAIERGRAVLSRDPLREHVHRQLMRCHHRMGDRPLAIRQYRECARVLDEELGIRPMEGTHRLYRQIEEGLDPPLADLAWQPPRARGGAAPIDPRVSHALTRVEAALAELRGLAREEGKPKVRSVGGRG